MKSPSIWSGSCSRRGLSAYLDTTLGYPVTQIFGYLYPNVQGMPVTYQPRPIPSTWNLESSRHSVQCLSTTSRLSNPGSVHGRSKNNKKHLLDSKTSASCAPWHNSPSTL